MRKPHAFVLFGLVAILIGSCGPAQSAGQPIQRVVVSPESSEAYWPTEGWRTSAPEEQGMDSETLAEMFKAIGDQGHDIDSVTVIRNGTMVADATVYPFQPDSRHIIHSCTKSIVSALIGIAIDKGYIEGVDQPIIEFFPGRSVANLDADKRAMTLEHVLMMAGGWECRDSYLYRWRGLHEMMESQDWVGHMLDLPMVEKPGTRFEYCNGGSFLLSAIIQETTGLSALAFAEKHLFGPLGISDVDWPSNPQGISIGWGEMHMRPHDMAKIGYLYLREGEWDGEQVVPADWVAASTRKRIDATLEDGYGYQWWVAGGDVYMALGYAGQYIVVVPEKDMVVVFSSQLEERDFYTPQRLLEDYIIPAARSPAPLPANPDGVAALEAAIRDLATPSTATGPTDPAPVEPEPTEKPAAQPEAEDSATPETLERVVVDDVNDKLAGPGEAEAGGPGEVEGWAVLAEKDDYSDVGKKSLLVDYIGIAQMRQMLEDQGWEPTQIHDLREFDRETLQADLDWLATQADEDDIVLVYVAAHGSYLRDVLSWSDFFAADWEQIPSPRRLLIIDACQAANYAGAIADDPMPYLSLAAVAGDEYGWSGLEEEGLPIIGGVFTHYFAAAFGESEADVDGDGFVSAQEAALLAEEQQRTYMHEVVFAVPEFVEMYRGIGVSPDQDPTFPDVVIDDTVGEPLYLYLDAYH